MTSDRRIDPSSGFLSPPQHERRPPPPRGASWTEAGVQSPHPFRRGPRSARGDFPARGPDVLIRIVLPGLMGLVQRAIRPGGTDRVPAAESTCLSPAGADPRTGAEFAERSVHASATCCARSSFQPFPLQDPRISDDRTLSPSLTWRSPITEEQWPPNHPVAVEKPKARRRLFAPGGPPEHHRVRGVTRNTSAGRSTSSLPRRRRRTRTRTPGTRRASSDSVP